MWCGRPGWLGRPSGPEAGKERACEGGKVAYCGTHATGPDSEMNYWGICGEPSECDQSQTNINAIAAAGTMRRVGDIS